MKTDEAFVIKDIHKQMGAVRALRGVSFEVRGGAVHAVIGHNGSGKSTLVKILSGVLTADDGSFKVVGRDGTARTARVATVFQDLGLGDDLSVFENLMVNSLGQTRFGWVNMKAERRRARTAMAALGIDLPLDIEAVRLPESERVMLCVARAMVQGGLVDADRSGQDAVDLLLLDEPTSSLPRQELESFRRLIGQLRAETQVTMMIVTHNPGDIGAMCTDVTALRGGQVMATLPAGEVEGEALVEMMAGQQLVAREFGSQRNASLRGADPSAPIFVSRGIFTEDLAEPVSLSASAGEFIGITGLEGSGFGSFIAALTGVTERSGGDVVIQGRQVRGGPTALAEAGAVYIPADRARTSGIPEAMVYENMTLGWMGAFTRKGLINLKRERAAVTDMLKRLRVEPPDPNRVLSDLSGGQQQKVIIGRALLSHAKVLLFEEPTAAVDVGARDDILGYLREVTREGGTVLAASVEFEWMPTVCDRIIVFHLGRIAGELVVGEDIEVTEEEILALAYGGGSG